MHSCETCGAGFKAFPSQKKRYCTRRCAKLSYWEVNGTVRGYEGLWNSWRAMNGRCSNQKAKDWRWYGGRGITVTPDWQNTFVNFKDWALLNGYLPGLTIDRIDPNQGYSPENCRWVTQAEQNRNTRANIFSHESAALVRAMRGIKSAAELAAEFKTSRTQIYGIWGGKIWPEVDPLK